MEPPTYRILHLPDLHFGSRSQYYDSCGPDDVDGWADAAAKSIEQGLKAHGGLSADGQNCSFDLIVLNGDLTCFGQQLGMDAAVSFVRNIQQRVWRGRDILVLPGNHDIIFGDPPPDLHSTTRVVVPVEKAKREKRYRETYERIAAASGIEECRTLDPFFLSVLKFDKKARIGIFGLNSSRIEGWSNPGLGFVGYDQMEILAESLLTYERESGVAWRRLAFLHHHLLVMDPVAAKAARSLQWDRHFSLTHDAGDVLAAAADFKIDFFVHGHYHRPEIREQANSELGYGRVLSAGSPGVKALDCEALHHFYVIELFDDPAGYELQTENGPKLRVWDFRRSLLAAEDGTWKRSEPYDFPLHLRKDLSYSDSKSEKDRRKRKAEASEAFLFNYETYPLARACLQPEKMMSANTELELYELMDAAWRRLWKQRKCPAEMLDIFADLIPYMEQNKRELLKEFEGRLDHRESAISFEMFLIEKIQLDSRYRDEGLNGE